MRVICCFFDQIELRVIYGFFERFLLTRGERAKASSKSVLHLGYSQNFQKGPRCTIFESEYLKLIFESEYLNPNI